MILIIPRISRVSQLPPSGGMDDKLGYNQEMVREKVP